MEVANIALEIEWINLARRDPAGRSPESAYWT